MHALIRQWAELRTQGGDHPTGKIDVAAIGGLLMLLNAHHHLLRNETMPAAQGLGVLAGVGVVVSHVSAHDVCGVLGNV